MELKVDKKYYLQIGLVLAIAILTLILSKMDWLIKLIIFQVILFSLLELLNIICTYKISQEGIFLKTLFGKKNILWNEAITVSKTTDAQHRTKELVVYTSQDFVRLNKYFGDLTIVEKKINEKIIERKINNNIVLSDEVESKTNISSFKAMLISITVVILEFLVLYLVGIVNAAEILSIKGLMRYMLMIILTGYFIVYYYHNKL